MKKAYSSKGEYNLACVPDQCHTGRNFQISFLVMRYLFLTMKSLVQATYNHTSKDLYFPGVSHSSRSTLDKRS